MLDLSSSELRKSAKSVSIVKLQSLLDLALNADSSHAAALNADSHVNDDGVFREDVKVVMMASGLYDWLLKVIGVSGFNITGEDADQDGVAHAHAQEEQKKEKDDKKLIGSPALILYYAHAHVSHLAIDAFALDYTVKFPLSLVISRKTILRYQLLFRFLLHLKHVEQSLSAMWIEQKTTPWRRPVPQHPEFQQWRSRVFLLRASMLSFVQQILAFSTFEVLEPNWKGLEAKLEKVQTVDQLLRDHVDFLDTCLKECMLTSSKLLKVRSSDALLFCHLTV